MSTSAQAQAWNRAHPERHAASERRYRQRHPEIGRQYKQRIRTRAVEVLGSKCGACGFSIKSYEEVWKLHGAAWAARRGRKAAA